MIRRLSGAREGVVGGGNRDIQLAARKVMNNFTEDELTVSAGNVFLNRELQMFMGKLSHRY